MQRFTPELTVDIFHPAFAGASGSTGSLEEEEASPAPAPVLKKAKWTASDAAGGSSSGRKRNGKGAGGDIPTADIVITSNGMAWRKVKELDAAVGGGEGVRKFGT